MISYCCIILHNFFQLYKKILTNILFVLILTLREIYTTKNARLYLIY